MNAREILTAARGLIEDPEHWTQGAAARDANGRKTVSTGTNACQWCAFGAVQHVVGEKVYGLSSLKSSLNLLDSCAVDAGFDVDDTDGKMAIAVLNDSTDHATVLKTFDCAIAKASA